MQEIGFNTFGVNLTIRTILRNWKTKEWKAHVNYSGLGRNSHFIAPLIAFIKDKKSIEKLLINDFKMLCDKKRDKCVKLDREIPEDIKHYKGFFMKGKVDRLSTRYGNRLTNIEGLTIGMAYDYYRDVAYDLEAFDLDVREGNKKATIYTSTNTPKVRYYFETGELAFFD